VQSSRHRLLPMIVLVSLEFQSAPAYLRQSVHTLPGPTHGSGDINSYA